ncbi:VTT domain-containing protein [Patescibacteria group bacterium]|nr:VTT domain-containing protein [Patescibacteria group bacterium]MBU2263257.1 VTT domain-containing protein [Patescibacteria group bacterium]
MQEFITQLLLDHSVLAPVIFIIIRILSVIFSPIPGFAIDIPGILVFGWLPAFIYSEIGVITGAMIAFFIARKFKEPLIRKFVSLQKLHTWENKLSEKQEFWTFVSLRLISKPFFDYISYAAGLGRISAKKFFLATIIGVIPVEFLFFYFGGIFLNKGIYYAILFIIAIIIIGLVFKKISLKNKTW